MGYYQGDFYQGDPGFLSLFKKAASFGAGFIPGVGGIASKAIARIPVPARRVIGKVSRAVVKHPVLSAAGAAGVVGAVGGSAAGAGVMGQRMAAPTGMATAGMPRGMGFGRRRRMRVTNPKALRRAIRRTQGFAKLAMRTIHLVHPKKKVRFGGFKHRRRKAA